MRSSNRIHDAFEAVKAGEELKALTKDYLRTARQRESRRRRRAEAGKPVFRRAFASLCVMLVLVLGSGGYFLLGMPVSYVSIDVNPSIELTLNRLDRVITAEAYNEDGIMVLDAISVWGLYYTKAIEQLMESEAMQPYLLEEAGLTFTVASDSGKRENALLNGIESTSGCLEHGGRGYRADFGAVQEAHESGLSLGKYAAYQVLTQYDSSITTEDCHNMTMSEIHGLIEEHAHGEHNETGGHNGSGDCRMPMDYEDGPAEVGSSAEANGGEGGSVEANGGEGSSAKANGGESSSAEANGGEGSSAEVNGSEGSSVEANGGEGSSAEANGGEGSSAEANGGKDSSVEANGGEESSVEEDSVNGTDQEYDGYGDHGKECHSTGHGHSHE